MNNTIILLRRNEEDLAEHELDSFRQKFGQDLNFVRTDPRDYKEHLADCKKLQPVAVLLPMERPIPSAAMDEGFVHVAMIPGPEEARMMKLLPLKPSFEPI